MTPSHLKTIQQALSTCKIKLIQSPTFQPLLSVQAQLAYLLDLIEGRSTDSSRLSEIILGVYAAREFESSDMAFASLLYEVEAVVDAMRLEAR